MKIPQSDILPTTCMGQIFKNTTATYKFYWFIGILDLFVRHGKTRISISDIMIEMVSNAWYPVCYFHLSFGKSESLYNAIHEIQQTFNIPINESPKDLSKWLHENIDDKKVSTTLSFLQKNVPYRFLSPWIRTNDNVQMVLRSQTFENDCLYKLLKIDNEL